MRVKLSSRNGWWNLPGGRCVLGRDRECDLVLDDPRLSRKHAAFVVDDGGVRVEDLGSANGVHLNGDLVNGASDLRDGDLLIVGPFTFDITVDTAGETPAAVEGSLVAEGTASESEFMPSTDHHLRTTEGMDGLPAYQPPALPDDPLTPNPGDASGAHRADTPLASRPLPPGHPLLEGDSDDHTPAAGTEQESSQRLRPQSKRQSTDPLQPNDPASRLRLELAVIRWRRLFAGILDFVTVQLVCCAIMLPLLVIGAVFALQQGGAGFGPEGLQLGADEPAGLGALTLHLLHPAVLGETVAAIDRLRSEDRGAFLGFFLAATVALLAWVLVHTVYLVAATAIKGAPLWHRRLGLAIRERETGYFPSAARSLARWVLAMVLSPAAVIAALLGVRGPHDVICGCALRRREAVTERQRD